MNENIVKKTKYGIIWNGIEKFSAQIISFILNVILARLLEPEIYGTVGLLVVFINISTVFIDSGFSRALIQKQDRSEKDFSTIFFTNIFTSIFFYIAFFFCSPIIANFYDRPELTLFARILFIVIPLNALCFVQNVKLQTSIDFKSIAIINTISAIFSSGISIILAYNGFGIWALIFQRLTATGISLILLILRVRWIPRDGFSFESFKTLFNFGWKILITQIIYTIIDNIIDLFIGKRYKPKELGLYTRANQFPSLICGTVISIFNTTTFPLLASLQNDNEELRNVLKRLLKYIYIIIVPCMFGLFSLSEEIVTLLLSDKWIEVVSYLQLASLAYLFEPAYHINTSLMMAKGRSDVYMTCNFIKIPITIIWLVLTLPRGIKVIIIGRIFFNLISLLIASWYAYQLLHFGFIKQIFSCYKYYISSILMLFVLSLIKDILHISLFPRTIILILLGGLIYFIGLLILHEKLLISLIRKHKNQDKKNDRINEDIK